MITVNALIDRWADERPDQPFLIAPETDRQLVFGDLRRHALMLGRELSVRGIGKGEKVAFLMDNGAWTASLFLSVMYSGRVIVPINAVSGDAQIQYVLEHSDCRAVFVSATYLERIRGVIDSLSGTIAVIPTDEDEGPEWTTAAASGPMVEADVKPHDDALLIYTSGTTGRPKGVLHTHRSIIAGARNTVQAHLLSARDRGLCVLPLYHINAEIVSAVAPLVSGGSVVMPRRFSTGNFWQLIEQHGCTWFSAVPTIIAYLLGKAPETAAGVKGRPGFEQVRFGRSASSALPPATHRGFEDAFGISIVETMGLSETAAQILSNPPPPHRSRYGSPGIAYGNEVMALRPDGQPAGPSEIGELVVRGENVMKEYYKNPEITRETLNSDGWLRTGDLGYQDAEGFFFVTGRIKELIIKGGENIAPREIDDVLHQHPAVLQAAAFAVEDPGYGQEVMACAVLKDGVRCDSGELREFCVRQLGEFKAPRRVAIVGRLPRGPSGKIQRLKIAEMLEELESAVQPAGRREQAGG